MKGLVFRVNREIGIAAVQTQPGEYSIFDFHGNGPVETGDAVRWEGNTLLGPLPLCNLTKNKTFEVFFQCHQITQEQLNRQFLVEPA